MKATTKQAQQIAKLNELCFGEEDFYNKAERVASCEAFLMYQRRRLVAYALVKPGRVATLERYGVRPGANGKGLGFKVLLIALKSFKAISTYAAGSNGASCAALTRAGFFITGTDNGFVTFMYLQQ